jgi:hypothetical protein
VPPVVCDEVLVADGQAEFVPINASIRVPNRDDVSIGVPG